MEQSPILGLPYIKPSQAQKHVTHNEAIRVLDMVAQIAIADRDLAAPPGAPADGARYLVATGASGAWAGHDGDIAAWVNGQWEFFTPNAGWLAWIEDEAALVAFDGSSWAEAGGGSVSGADLFGINTTADASNRLAVKSDNVLLSHDDVTPGSGDARVVLNKVDAAHTASMLFQNNWSGRAEFGLTGDDNWHVKVSGDGSAWTEAMVIDKATGFAGFGATAPAAPVHARGDGQALVVENALSSSGGWTIAPGHPGNYDDFLIISTGNDINTSANHKLRLHPSIAPTFPVGVAVSDGKGVESETSGALAYYKPYDGTRGSMSFRGPNNTGAAEYRIIGAYHDGSWHVVDAGAWMMSSAGAQLGIGTTAPSTTLHVEGPARVGQYTVAGLPSASASGAGAMVFVSDETGGATMAFSDGTDWRRMSDRAIVSS